MYFVYYGQRDKSSPLLSFAFPVLQLVSKAKAGVNPSARVQWRHQVDEEGVVRGGGRISGC